MWQFRSLNEFDKGEGTVTLFDGISFAFVSSLIPRGTPSQNEKRHCIDSTTFERYQRSTQLASMEESPRLRSNCKLRVLGELGRCWTRRRNPSFD